MASSSLRPVLRVLGMDKFVLLSVRVLAGGQCCWRRYCISWRRCAWVMDHALALSYFADAKQCSCWGVGAGVVVCSVSSHIHGVHFCYRLAVLDCNACNRHVRGARCFGRH